VKVGDRVKVASGFTTGTVTQVIWRGAASSGVSYIDRVSVMYDNGMISTHDPRRLEVIDEDA
jgi:peptide methionine sulfoxide reductase MsrA